LDFKTISRKKLLESGFTIDELLKAGFIDRDWIIKYLKKLTSTKLSSQNLIDIEGLFKKEIIDKETRKYYYNNI
jgi:hypothetical protein